MCSGILCGNDSSADWRIKEPIKSQETDEFDVFVNLGKTSSIPFRANIFSGNLNTKKGEIFQKKCCTCRGKESQVSQISESFSAKPNATFVPVFNFGHKTLGNVNIFYIRTDQTIYSTLQTFQIGSE